MSVSITLEPRQDVALDPALHVVCDFVQGWAFGNALGIAIRAIGGTWEVMKVEVGISMASSVCHRSAFLGSFLITPQFSVSLLQKQRLAPSQTRVVPILINQLKAFQEPILQLFVTLLDSQASSQITLLPTFDIRHWSSWGDVVKYKAIQATYFLAGTPILYQAIPPLLPNHGPSKPPIIALRGNSCICH